MTIPKVIETYKENTVEPRQEFYDEPLEYFPAEGERILVNLWCRFPSYDFIFGTPAPENPRREKEFGFFQFRKLKEGKAMAGWQVYVDQTELEDMCRGFAKIMEVSRANRKEEWDTYDENEHAKI